MEIHTAGLLDLKALRRLEQICFEKDAWPLLDLVAVLTWPEVIRLKAVEDGEMIGFAACDPRPTQVVAWLSTIAVDPHFQRRGIGRMLLRACEERVRQPRIKLSVRISNYGAIALYEQEGYQTVDVWGRYYSDDEDALIMEKHLQPDKDMRSVRYNDRL
ncbi:MAG: GNAT family N-acetyltransferase [Chloroflexi bacterium]|nr:GNAT family N-acetyltransferase [Chloroflexota bacterium]